MQLEVKEVLRRVYLGWNEDPPVEMISCRRVGLNLSERAKGTTAALWIDRMKTA